MSDTETLIEQAFNEAYYQPPAPYVSEQQELVDSLLLDGFDDRDLLREWLRLTTTVQETHELIAGYFDKHNVYYRKGEPLVEQIQHFAHQVERDAQGQFASVNAFRDTVIAEFTGMRLVVDMVLSASTHREKDARLRGLEEIINRGIGRLQQVHFELFRWERWPYSVFSSDSAEARLQRQNWELEDQLKRYHAQFGELSADGEPVSNTNDDIPW